MSWSYCGGHEKGDQDEITLLGDLNQAKKGNTLHYLAYFATDDLVQCKLKIVAFSMFWSGCKNSKRCSPVSSEDSQCKHLHKILRKKIVT